jgi:hypothetical protein
MQRQSLVADTKQSPIGSFCLDPHSTRNHLRFSSVAWTAREEKIATDKLLPPFHLNNLPTLIYPSNL